MANSDYRERTKVTREEVLSAPSALSRALPGRTPTISYPGSLAEAAPTEATRLIWPTATEREVAPRSQPPLAPGLASGRAHTVQEYVKSARVDPRPRDATRVEFALPTPWPAGKPGEHPTLRGAGSATPQQPRSAPPTRDLPASPARADSRTAQARERVLRELTLADLRDARELPEDQLRQVAGGRAAPPAAPSAAPASRARSRSNLERPAVQGPVPQAGNGAADAARAAPARPVLRAPAPPLSKPSLEAPGTAADAPSAVVSRASLPLPAVSSEPATHAPPVASVAPASPAPVKRDGASPLFRAEALAAYQRGDRVASVLRVTSVSRWALLAALAVLVISATLLCVLGRVEVSSLARGVLRSPGGVQPVVAQLAGTVREVLVQNGEHVAMGQVIARIDATPLRAELQEAEQRLALLEQQRVREAESARVSHLQSTALLKGQVQLLEKRRARQTRRIARHERRVARVQAPELDGLVEASVRDDQLEAFESAHDDSLRLSEELARLRLQISSEQNLYQQNEYGAQQRLDEARARRDAVRTLLEQTELRAPIEGRVDALRVFPGQSMQLGEWAARVVRDVAPRSIVAFLPERDRAFLREGAHANVEVDQLPVSEFGLLPARVVRIGRELADTQEVHAALGEATELSGPHFRVELSLLDDAGAARAAKFLRPGTLVSARVALRERRILSLVFEPARKWLE